MAIASSEIQTATEAWVAQARADSLPGPFVEAYSRFALAVPRASRIHTLSGPMGLAGLSRAEPTAAEPLHAVLQAAITTGSTKVEHVVLESKLLKLPGDGLERQLDYMIEHNKSDSPVSYRLVPTSMERGVSAILNRAGVTFLEGASGVYTEERPAIDWGIPVDATYISLGEQTSDGSYARIMANAMRTVGDLAMSLETSTDYLSRMPFPYS